MTDFRLHTGPLVPRSPAPPPPPPPPPVQRARDTGSLGTDQLHQVNPGATRRGNAVDDFAARQGDQAGTDADFDQLFEKAVGDAAGKGADAIGDVIKGRPTGPSPQEAAIAEAIESGEPVEFTNAAGQTEEVSVRKTGTEDGKDVYEVTAGEETVEVKIPPEHNAAEVIGEVADYYTQQPPHLRDALEQVVIENGGNPQDPYWEEEYDIPGFTSAATGGNGTITFYHGTRNINQDIFDHEMGHLAGEKIEGEQDSWLDRIIDEVTDAPHNVPEGWEDAAREDGNHVSDYATNSSAEDFAETYQVYLEAQRKGPEALEQFREEYPARAALLDEIFADEYA